LSQPLGGTHSRRRSFDGRPITELDPRELRRRAALVLQTPVLFEGTVRKNLMVHAPAVALEVSQGRLRETLSEVGLEATLLERDAHSRRRRRRRPPRPSLSYSHSLAIL
jgi:ABC-type iron transport system FetAB ATPase subunit